MYLFLMQFYIYTLILLPTFDLCWTWLFRKSEVSSLNRDGPLALDRVWGIIKLVPGRYGNNKIIHLHEHPQQRPQLTPYPLCFSFCFAASTSADSVILSISFNYLGHLFIIISHKVPKCKS